MIVIRAYFRQPRFRTVQVRIFVECVSQRKAILVLAFNLLAPSVVRANAISPEEIHVSWRDGNPETPAENRVDFMSKHRFNILQ